MEYHGSPARFGLQLSSDDGTTVAALLATTEVRVAAVVVPSSSAGRSATEPQQRTPPASTAAKGPRTPSETRQERGGFHGRPPRLSRPREDGDRRPPARVSPSSSEFSPCVRASATAAVRPRTAACADAPTLARGQGGRSASQWTPKQNGCPAGLA